MIEKKHKILLIGIYLFMFFVTGVAFSFQQPEQWNIRTLKEYFELRFEAVEQRFKDQALAILTKQAELEKRFDNTNEWRASYDDLVRTYIPRLEYEGDYDALTTRVNDLREKLDKIENMKSGGNVVWAYVIAGISLMIAIFTLKDKIIKKE